MKVLLVSHVSNKYGAGRSLLSLIDGLHQKGVECYVITPPKKSDKGSLIKELKKRNVKCNELRIYSWTFTDKKGWKHILCSVWNLLASVIIAVKAYFWKVDIIHTNSSIIPVGALAALLIRKPHIWHIREFGPEDYGLRFTLGEPLSIWLMNKLSFRIIVISKALRKKYSHYILQEKLRTIYNPAHSFKRNYRLCSRKGL